MPVQKFRSTDDPLLQERSRSGSPENLRRLAFVLAFWSHVRPRSAPRGVFKYRSIEESQAATLSRR
jgi:hypothetical protein